MMIPVSQTCYTQFIEYTNYVIYMRTMTKIPFLEEMVEPTTSTKAAALIGKTFHLAFVIILQRHSTALYTESN